MLEIKSTMLWPNRRPPSARFEITIIDCVKFNFLIIRQTHEIPIPRNSPIKSPKTLKETITIPAKANNRIEIRLPIPKTRVFELLFSCFTHLKASKPIIIASASDMNRV